MLDWRDYRWPWPLPVRVFIAIVIAVILVAVVGYFSGFLDPIVPVPMVNPN
jgi:hypothetical protein